MGVQLLQALHAEGHYLGVLQPDRIILQGGKLYMLELTAGQPFKVSVVFKLMHISFLLCVAWVALLASDAHGLLTQ